MRRLAAVTLAVGLLLPACGGNSLSIKGNSMAPTIKDGQVIAYDPDAYKASSPRRADIVVFKRSGAMIVLRVVGLPGDHVVIRDGGVYINNVGLPETYLAVGTRTSSPAADFQVPADSYFLLADNRATQGDSRYLLGFVSRKDIAGKVNL